MPHTGGGAKDLRASKKGPGKDNNAKVKDEPRATEENGTKVDELHTKLDGEANEQGYIEPFQRLQGSRVALDTFDSEDTEQNSVNNDKCGRHRLRRNAVDYLAATVSKATEASLFIVDGVAQGEVIGLVFRLGILDDHRYTPDGSMTGRVRGS